MPDCHFMITRSHRARFGGRSVADLRADATGATGPAKRWLIELADRLERAHMQSLDDTPVGWGWTIAVPPDAEQPDALWRSKHGHRRTGLLRVLSAATGANMSDAASARITDLGNALERDGFEYLNDAPTDWWWVPGGRE